MKKKMISLGLAMIIGISSSLPIYANETTETYASPKDIQLYLGRNVDFETQENILDELHVLYEYAPLKEDLVDIIPYQNDYIYRFETESYDGNSIISDIVMNTKENGDVEIKITEGDLSNTLLFTKDNKVFLDGNKVTIEGESSEVKKQVQPRDRSIWTTKDCPYGSKSDYSHYVDDVSIKNLGLESSIAELTAVAFSILIGAYSFFAGCTTAVADYIIKQLIKYDNETTHLSMEGKEYYHKNGYGLPNGIYAKRVTGKWYTKTDFKGNSVSMTVYNCKEYY